MSDTEGFVSVDELLTMDDNTTEVLDLPSGKGKVELQPLTRAEVLTGKKLKQLGEIDASELECVWISSALVNPRMTPKEVEKWQKRRGSGPDLMAISKVVTRMSGLDEGTPKSNLQNAGSVSRNGSGDVHRSKVEPDDSGTPNGDV